MGKINTVDNKKKLSKAYRLKKRTGQINKADSKSNPSFADNRKARIIVRNLSFKATEDELRNFYSKYGDIDDVNLPRHPNGSLVGCGFVQFKKVTDASKAIFNTNKKEFLGRTIASDWAIAKAKYVEKLEQQSSERNDNENPEIEEIVEKSQGEENKVKVVGRKRKEKLQHDRKLHKQLKQRKRARIIVRNLPFKITEEELRQHFSQFGEIDEITLAEKNGRRVGCAFVQFQLVQSAAKAVHYANMKQLRDRTVVVDWALPKNKYQNDANSNVSDNAEIKEEVEGDAEIKEETISDEENATTTRDVSEVAKSEDSDSDEQSVKSENDESGNDSQEDGNSEEEQSEGEEEKHPRRVSNDINEGKTVFIKNVPFTVKNEDLKECMEQFGPVYYALVCVDPLTEHSRGTAFVKFRNAEDAEKCLSAGTELKLHDQVLDPHKALARDEIKDKQDSKKEKSKDSRNLYLVKEGVILAGSPAAKGVSASDMARRLQLEQWKSQMLRNLNMFVSRTRLVIQNLPPTCDDQILRQLIKKHSGPKAVMTEARVMRDLKNVDGNGTGKSKEYGFVCFTSHEDALKALRSINNNPNIFTPAKRPIVAFSIENRIMVNAKQRRIQKSREKNPLWKGYDKTNSSGKVENNGGKDRRQRFAGKGNQVDETKGEASSYSGVTGKPGVNKMRSKFNLKSQAMMHKESLKQEKKAKKRTKELINRKKEEVASRKEPKPKQGKRKEGADERNFSKMVNNYKTKLMAAPAAKSKWYEAK